jgi:perosamine synthetase
VTALALHGGTPVRRQLLPYGRQTLDERDVAVVVDVLRGDWLTGGPAVGAFEAALAARVGAPHAVAFSSGTAALHAAVAAAGIGPGDEVLTTPLTFCATANAVLYAGATPVFADVEATTLLLDPDAVRAAIGPRTRALLPVDYAGHPADLDALRALARDRGLCLIEDAAHALGARIGERHVGSIADLTVFSFHPVKHIACGEGGMVTTADAALAARLRRFRNHGLDSDARDRRAGSRWAYDMVELGFNYRLTDLAAALGHSQLARLDANLARRAELVRRYHEVLGPVRELTLLPERAGCTSAHHLLPVQFDTAALGVDRDELLAALRAEGIGVNVHYRPVPSLAYYRARGHRPERCPRALAATDRLLSLPLFHGMGDADFADVITAVTKVLDHYRARRR